MNWRSVVISCISIPFLYSCKLLQIKYKEKLRGFPIPSELFLVIVTTTICYYVGAGGDELKIVGPVPGGLPAPTVPPFSALFATIFSDALAIAIVFGLSHENILPQFRLETLYIF